MSQNVKGTFGGPDGHTPGALSDVLVIPSGSTVALLNLSGASADDVTAQKSTDGGQTWSDQTTYTAPEVDTAITVAHGEQWRLAAVGTPTNEVHYSLSVETMDGVV